MQLVLNSWGSVWYRIHSEPAVAVLWADCPSLLRVVAQLIAEMPKVPIYQASASHLVESEIGTSAFKLPWAKSETKSSQFPSSLNVGSTQKRTCPPPVISSPSLQYYQTRWTFNRHLHTELSTSSGISLHI